MQTEPLPKHPKPLRFHWRLLQRGDPQTATAAKRVTSEGALPDLKAQIHFCQQAEQCGIDSLLVDIHHAKPDPMTLSLALARVTSTMNYLVAYRPGLMSPTLFVQQVNTFSALTNGRIALNMVAGHSPEEQRYYGDHLAHDERYARMDEFLAVCHAFWQRKGGVTLDGRYYRIEDGRLNTPFVSDAAMHPEIYLGGNSEQARQVAMRHASCWMRFADTPAALRPLVEPVVQQGTGVGLRLSIITRPTRAEALDAAHTLVASAVSDTHATAEQTFVRASDAVSIRATYALAEDEWLTPSLWTGAVRTIGATALALVGSPEEVATGLIAYKNIGVSQFILSGWPKLDAMIRFGRDVLPLVRDMEREKGEEGRARREGGKGKGEKGRRGDGMFRG